MNSRYTRGFIALMSVIIISTVLLLAVTASSFIGFYTRSNILDTELKARSVAAADACANTAFLKFRQNIDPTGLVRTLNSFDQCQIGTVTGTTERTFKIQATSSNAVTNLQITVNMSDLTVTSWHEVPTF